MKIIPNPTPSSKTPIVKNAKKDQTKASPSFLNPETEGPTSFLDILESIVPSNQDSTKHLNELWRDLPDLEKALIQSQSKENLENYKKHIKEIAELILKDNYKVQQAPRRNRTDEKDLRYVKIIDEKLHILASTMFSSTNSAFALLRQFEDIRGFLVDLKG